MDTIVSSIEDFLRLQTPNTKKTYRRCLRYFVETFPELDPLTNAPGVFTMDHIHRFIDEVLFRARPVISDATRRLYSSAVRAYFDFLDTRNLTTLSYAEVGRVFKKSLGKRTERLPHFSRDDLEIVLEYAATLHQQPTDDERSFFRNLRDRAFVMTLADTGLRVHEACNLRREDLDWNEGRAMVVGKGSRENQVRFSDRAIDALRLYLRERQKLDGGTGKKLGSLPVFAQHSRRAGTGNIKPISTVTGRNIIKRLAKAALWDKPEHVERISPHSFRHYFVTYVLQGTGNLRLTQRLARHKDISTTTRYTHLVDQELDEAYHDLFNKRND